MLCFQAVLKVGSYKKIKVHMATKAFDMRIVEPSFEVKGMFILAKPRCFFWNSVLKTKPATKSDEKRWEKKFYAISFLCNSTKIFLQKSFRERTRTLNPKNGASYGWSLSQVSEHVFMQNLFLQLAKDTEYNWVLIEAVYTGF